MFSIFGLVAKLVVSALIVLVLMGCTTTANLSPEQTQVLHDLRMQNAVLAGHVLLEYAVKENRLTIEQALPLERKLDQIEQCALDKAQCEDFPDLRKLRNDPIEQMRALQLLLRQFRLDLNQLESAPHGTAKPVYYPDQHWPNCCRGNRLLAT